jgi:phytoene synthase
LDLTSFSLLHDNMAMITAIIVTVSIVAPYAGATFSVTSSVTGRKAPFISAPLRSSTLSRQQGHPFVAAPMQGPAPMQGHSLQEHLPFMRTTATRAAPNLAPQRTEDATQALDFCPGDQNSKCNYDNDHRICAQLLDKEGKPLNWGTGGNIQNVMPNVDSHITSGMGDASKCINISTTAKIIKQVGCENVHINCDATDVRYVTARNWWAYIWRGHSLAPAVNCLQKICSLEAQQAKGESPLDAVLSPNYGVSNNGLFGDWNKIIRAEPPNFDYTQALADQDPKALASAYKKCEDVTQEFSKTFYIGTALLRPEARKHGWAIYAWCRRVDDIVDSPQAMLNPTQLDSDLIEWNRRLNGIWQGKPTDPFDLAMADTVRYYPTLSIDPFREMIAGMVMDVPGHPNGKLRYQNFDELYLYCYRVAGTVGLMMLPILGSADGVKQEDAKVPALALGIALQLTNILRDVGEDLRRGRIYLPQDELKKFGITEEDLFARKVTDKYKAFMKWQIARAREWYKEAAYGIPMLAPDARFAVQASLDLYSRILDKIEENGYDNLNKRAYTTGFEKLQILPGSWHTSKTLALDKAVNLVNLVSSSQDPDETNVGGVLGAGVVSAVVVATLVALRTRRRSSSDELMLV